MNDIPKNLEGVRDRIRSAANRYGRNFGDIQLLAVSKTRPASDIRAALEAGQFLFGESYLQEALEKIRQLGDCGAQWHFIGKVQSNKTRDIAENFDWVHSIDKAKQARRLNEQRPAELPPLNVCLQIKVDPEESKGGLLPDEARSLIAEIADLPRLKIRGLMTLPAPAEGLQQQRRPFRMLRQLRDELATSQIPLHTLSMGMSDDLEAAIAEGSTIVRVGTAIFGPRNPLSQ